MGVFSKKINIEIKAQYGSSFQEESFEKALLFFIKMLKSYYLSNNRNNRFEVKTKGINKKILEK